MKTKLITLFGIFILVFFVSSSIQAQTKVGGGFAWGSEVEDIGIQLNGDFTVADYFTVNPNFIYYFTGSNFNFFELNADAHYYFLKGDISGPYALGGINLGFFSSDFADSQTEFGLNLGGGYEFDLGSSIIPFAELKVTIISDVDQLVIAGGVRYIIGS